MRYLYNILTIVAGWHLKLIALFIPKIGLFVEGRKTVFDMLSQKISGSDKVIWFHAASLGEYEQGLPVMKKVRKLYPGHKILVTFFSPSGYEVRKNTTDADVVVYLPLDTLANAKKFVASAHPDMVFFIKYEFWPNYLNELKKRGIATYLISGIFRENQVFFKWYGGFYRKALTAFSHFFVQYESSKKLLQTIGFSNATVSGDTRYDRVSEILDRDNSLPFVEEFIDGKTCVVFGSSWPKDESMFTGFINSAAETKFIIAPHTFGHVKELQQSITKRVLLFSEREGKNLADYDVLIVDTVGLLTKIYSYADVAYVGGGFGTAGLHNILEPAAFGVPVIIGPNHTKFPEAVALVNMGGCVAVQDAHEMEDALSTLIYNEGIRHEKGHTAATFVEMNRGAVAIITNYLQHEDSKL